MFAIGLATVEQFFSQLFADPMSTMILLARPANERPFRYTILSMKMENGLILPTEKTFLLT
jgi:hypothetical protein